MNYAFSITTPKKETPPVVYKTVMPLPRGIVVGVEIQFPPGSYGLLHIHINRAVHQVWPHNSDANYIGNDQVIMIPAQYKLLVDPMQFEAYTWNEDTAYPHLVIVRFDVLEMVEEIVLTPEELARLAEAREV